MTETTRYAFLLVDSFSHLAFSCAIEPLRIANLLADRKLYAWSLLSEDGKHARSSNDLITLADRGLENIERNEHLLIVSGLGVQRYTTSAILNFVRRERVRGTKIGAICSGAYVLAKAGLLDGVRTAVHWQFHDLFTEEFPAVHLRRNVFVADDKFVTASGGTAAADLMLHLIGEQHGNELATAIADQMVYNTVREGSAEQRVSLQSRHGMRNAHLVKAIHLIEENVETPLAPCELADEVGVSTRQLERLFGKYMNTSPKRYIMEMRLNRARNLIVQSEQSIAQIAMACGFNSTSHFAKVFRSHFGISPVTHRGRLF